MAVGYEATTNGAANKLQAVDLPVHAWYRFVLSFPPHLVRHYLARFGIDKHHRVLDPFCGTGTTLVECKKLGIASVGIEAHPLTHFAAHTKLDWTPDPSGLLMDGQALAAQTSVRLAEDGVPDDSLPLFVSSNGQDAHSLRSLPADTAKLLLRDSISPRPLHKALTLIDLLNEGGKDAYVSHERLALAKALVFSGSNLHFGPEVGIGKLKVDAQVVAPFLDNVRTMARDLAAVSAHSDVEAVAHHADSRQLLDVLEPNSVDAVITSPPYPNEKDYTRTTRLESVLLGFIRDKHELRAVKQGLVRSNTRNVYKHDTDDAWVAQHPEIQRIAEAIEARRIELGKTSGFERMYARVTKLYFGGMARHLADLRAVLRPGAHLAYVVGDQASYLRVMIRTGQLLAEIGESLGYEVVGIDLFRTRLATATKEQLREEAVILRWPGAKN